MKHPGHTPPFRNAYGEPLRGSIAEIHYLPLGGVDQWVMVRGERIENPPLVILHGGPGLGETQFFRHYNAVLETRFTVVYWDQRGAGKSFDPKIPKGSMTVEQFIEDLDQLIDWVCKRVDTQHVAILGHSWGSALGALYSAQFPQKVSTYVGSAQIGDWPASEAASYAWALAEAERRGNERALEELTAIGPPPYDASALMTERTWTQRFDGQMRPNVLWNLGKIFFGGPESTMLDLPNVVRGFRFTLDTMWTSVSRLNLVKLVPTLNMPVFFFAGRRDRWVPIETSIDYFAALKAPSKKLIVFEQSGHEQFVDEPAKFNAAMLDDVWPVAAAADHAHAAA